MSLLHYIDNELGAFSQWDVIEQSGGSITQVVDSASLRGRKILRINITSATGRANVKKNIAAPAPGATLGYSVRFRINVARFGFNLVEMLTTGGDQQLLLTTSADSVYHVYSTTDTDGWPGLIVPGVSVGRWIQMACLLRRATANGVADGWFRLYINGKMIGEIVNHANFNAAGRINRMVAGVPWNGQAGMNYDLDDIKIGETLADLQPYRPWQQGTWAAATQPATVPGLFGAYRETRK